MDIEALYFVPYTKKWNVFVLFCNDAKELGCPLVFMTSIGKYHCAGKWKNFYSHMCAILGVFSYFRPRNRWLFYVYTLVKFLVVCDNVTRCVYVIYMKCLRCTNYYVHNAIEYIIITGIGYSSLLYLYFSMEITNVCWCSLYSAVKNAIVNISSIKKI